MPAPAAGAAAATDDLGSATNRYDRTYDVPEEAECACDGQAFQMLVESSQSTNLKLVDVARWLVGEVARRRTRRAATDGGRLDGQPPEATAGELLRPER